MRFLKVAVALVGIALFSTARAEVLWGFKDVSVNWLGWTKGTENRTEKTKKDFLYLELEGGAGFDWGEVYGFFDIENPGKKPENENGNERRTALKGTLRYYLGDTDFDVYLGVYNFSTDGFYEQDRVAGLGYRLQAGSFWMKPFLGIHDVGSSGFSGMNGYMLGWALGYSFKFFDQDFMISNWHEYEFNRDKDYKGNLTTSKKHKVTTCAPSGATCTAKPKDVSMNLAESGGKLKNGVNGALGLWWTPQKAVTVGLQYRYASYKLGRATYQDALIYSMRYNF